MEWTDIRLTVAKADAENAEAVATLIAEGGIYIEDYSDIEQQVAEIAHVDLIEQELLDKPRDTVIIHLYLEPGASQVETLALIAARMEAAGIPYTVETEGVEQEDCYNLFPSACNTCLWHERKSRWRSDAGVLFTWKFCVYAGSNSGIVGRHGEIYIEERYRDRKSNGF